MTQAHRTQPQPVIADDALTQTIAELAAADFSTRQIAAKVPLSQSAVARRLRKITEQNQLRRRQFWQTAMFALLTVSAMALAAAAVSIAITLAGTSSPP
jgi:hypothetical protein